MECNTRQISNRVPGLTSTEHNSLSVLRSICSRFRGFGIGSVFMLTVTVVRQRTTFFRNVFRSSRSSAHVNRLGLYKIFLYLHLRPEHPKQENYPR